MNRSQVFESYSEHVMHHRMFKRLTAAELQLCRDFLRDNESLDRHAFAHKVNRWFLDQPNKPKHLTDMWALLIQANVKAGEKNV